MEINMEAFQADILEVLKKHGIRSPIAEGQETLKFSATVTAHISQFQHAGGIQSQEGRRSPKIEIIITDKRYQY